MKLQLLNLISSAICTVAWNRCTFTRRSVDNIRNERRCHLSHVWRIKCYIVRILCSNIYGRFFCVVFSAYCHVSRNTSIEPRCHVWLWQQKQNDTLLHNTTNSNQLISVVHINYRHRYTGWVATLDADPMHVLSIRNWRRWDSIRKQICTN
jgi:hypothetical protein